MSADGLRIVVSGLIAQYPLGGVTWDYIQYPAGLAALGHDVYYIEDTGQWPYDPTSRGVSEGCEYNVRYLSTVMDQFGLADRWAYRFPWQDQWFGMSETERNAVIRSADLVINVSGTLSEPLEYGKRARLLYIDSDPVFTQIKLLRGQTDFRNLIDSHDVHFSFGERLAETDLDTGHSWLPTRQPVLLDQWLPAEREARNVFTTVMNWTSYSGIEFDGTVYGQKDIEFRRFLDLPNRVHPLELEIAMNIGKNRRAPLDLLQHRGWSIVDPETRCSDPDSYRDYLQSSLGEWSVAKNGYVVGNAGWFSCRSACYLAAGRPVVVQDTGFSPPLPTGDGLLTFTNPQNAADALREVAGDVDRHSAAARDLAESYFDSGQVLRRLLSEAFTPSGRSTDVVE